MSFSSLLPAPDRLHLLSLAADGAGITLTARTCSDVACCPLCGQPSSRVHSRYRRILADLPWQGIPARLLLWSRRFFCDAPDCVRRIFTERLPGVAIPYAHRTGRLRDWFTHVSFALGGEAGGRLLRALGVDGFRRHLARAYPCRGGSPTAYPTRPQRGRFRPASRSYLWQHPRRFGIASCGRSLTRSEWPDLRGVAHRTPRRGDHQPRPGRRVCGGSAPGCPCRRPGG
jgi:transposase IS204/IS1001/IS1096/IS1165 family protein